MAHPFTVPALTASILVAAGVGVHLGESAIAQIKPIYFQGPAVHPRDRGAAIDESRVEPQPIAYGQLYGWDEGYAARAADCGDCDALAARDAYAYSADVPYFGGREENWDADVPAPLQATPEPAVLYMEAPAPAVERAVARKEHIERFAYYPIDHDAAEEVAVAEPKLAPAVIYEIEPPASDAYDE